MVSVSKFLRQKSDCSAWITSTVGSVEAEWPHFAKEKKVGLGFLRGNVSEAVVGFSQNIPACVFLCR